MRVNRPQWNMPQNRQMNMPQSNAGSKPQPQPQAAQPKPNGNRNETAAMQLARKIQLEQGDKAAGYYLYAVRQFVAPQEIAHIESILKIKSQSNPRDTQDSGSKSNAPNMMQLLMSMMSGGKINPLNLMGMMSGQQN